MATAPVPTTEVGHVAPSPWAGTGRSPFGGWPLDEAEESAVWQWPESIRTADRMARHPQVQAVWWALTLPLRGDIWALDPQDADPARVDLLADDLDLPVLDERGDRRTDRRPNRRRRGRFSWSEHVRLMLLHLRYGCMFFVPVYDEQALADTGMARLRKLAPRFPRTISHIDSAPDGGLVGIRQWGNGPGAAREIPIGVDRLVAYVHEREGANWQGRSLFRPLYRPYELADRLERVEAMTIERNGMGVPTAEVVPGYAGQITQAQIDDAAAIAQAWRAGDASAAAMPPGFRMRLAGVEGTLPDAGPAIARHHTSMAKAVQAMFMELGSTQGGHRALGETFVEQFDAAVGGLATAIAKDFMTPHIVEDWWDLNYGPDDPAPAVVVSPGEVPVESIMALVSAGLIQRDDALEDWLRDRLRIPARAAVAAPPPANLGFLGGGSVAASHRGRPRRILAATEAQWATRLAGALAAIVDPAAIASAAADGASAADAVAAGLSNDLTTLESVLADLWAESYGTGAERAVATVASSALRPQPRSVAAALTGLLGQVRNLVASVVGSLRDRLVGAVDAAGPDVGTDALRDMVAGMASDHAAAGRIAVTESHRALVLGAVDTWRASGVDSFRWVRTSGDDEKDECADRDGEVDEWDDFPPLHPHCKCEVEPA